MSEPEEKPRKQTVTERVTALEVRVDELSRRMDEVSVKIEALTGYQKQLYEYLLRTKK